jgi:hypothetical protein
MHGREWLLKDSVPRIRLHSALIEILPPTTTSIRNRLSTNEPTFNTVSFPSIQSQV